MVVVESGGPSNAEKFKGKGKAKGRQAKNQGHAKKNGPGKGNSLNMLPKFRNMLELLFAMFVVSRVIKHTNALKRKLLNLVNLLKLLNLLWLSKQIWWVMFLNGFWILVLLDTSVLIRCYLLSSRR
ncbi:hypothetical protein KSS87_014248 [Heliosperma pusillum]|nr:hypothetical protein KSS87_014247 [Heliosperma pusillum]KAH9624683.1 hypothetical protein KSS87_014248 [Heliosperma pusillum]